MIKLTYLSTYHMVLTMDGCLILIRLNQKFHFTTDIFSLLQFCKERICQRGHKNLIWNWTVCYCNSKWGTSKWLRNTRGNAHWYCAIHKYTPSSLGDVPVPFAFVVIIVITLCSAVLFIGHVRQTFARIDLPPNAPEENENWYKTNYIYRHVCTCTGIIRAIFTHSPQLHLYTIFICIL